MHEEHERLLTAAFKDTEEMTQIISQFCDRGEELVRSVEMDLASDVVDEDCPEGAFQRLRASGQHVRAWYGQTAHEDYLEGPDIVVDTIARPDLALRVCWVRWSRGRVLGLCLFSVWLFCMLSDSVVSYTPVVYGMIQLVYLLVLIATVPEGYGPSRLCLRWFFLESFAYTLLAGSELRSLLSAPAWEAEGLIRAAYPTAGMLQAYILTGVYYMGRGKAWELLRVSCVLDGLCGLCVCLALRAVAGPNISFPPGSTSLVSAMTCWCEAIAIGVACTRRVRHRCRESTFVVSLQAGMRLETDSSQMTTRHDSAASCTPGG